jgi:hypothetical protein
MGDFGPVGPKGPKGDRGLANMGTRANLCVVFKTLNGAPFNAGFAIPSYCTGLTFVASGAYQTMTILSAGNYRITAAGAQGGMASAPYRSGGGFEGGLGATAAATVPLVAGDVLCIIVGMRPDGPIGNFDPGAGGGGSFVFKSDATCATRPALPIVAAGGGAGGDGSWGQGTPLGDAGAAPPGLVGYGGNAITRDLSQSGGGGVGWLGDGQNGGTPTLSGGGSHWAGGRGSNYLGAHSNAGGFGGGGGAGLVCNAGCNSGGGGGYSGGGGGAQTSDTFAGGGGSYAAGGTTAANVQSGHGIVTITLVP